MWNLLTSKHQHLMQRFQIALCEPSRTLLSSGLLSPTASSLPTLVSGEKVDVVGSQGDSGESFSQHVLERGSKGVASECSHGLPSLSPGLFVLICLRCFLSLPQ